MNGEDGRLGNEPAAQKGGARAGMRSDGADWGECSSASSTGPATCRRGVGTAGACSARGAATLAVHAVQCIGDVRWQATSWWKAGLTAITSA